MIVFCNLFNSKAEGLLIGILLGLCKKAPTHCRSWKCFCICSNRRVAPGRTRVIRGFHARTISRWRRSSTLSSTKTKPLAGKSLSASLGRTEANKPDFTALAAWGNDWQESAGRRVTSKPTAISRIRRANSPSVVWTAIGICLRISCKVGCFRLATSDAGITTQ